MFLYLCRENGSKMVSNLNSQYNVAMQAGVPVQMQGIDSEKVRKSVDNSYLANRAKASEETNPFAMLGLGAGIWYGLGQGMDKFNPKCAGKYEDSILGKIGGAGDKFSTKTAVGRKIESALNWLDKGFEKLAGKSKIVYSLRNHSTSPEWSFAKTPGAGVHGFLAMDTEQVFEEYLKPIAEHPAEEVGGMKIGRKYNAFQKLEQYGMPQSQIDALRDSVKNLDFNGKAIALQKAELKCLGVSDVMMSKIESKTGLRGLKKLAENLKVQKLGFRSMKEFKDMKGKFIDHPDRIMQILETAEKNGVKVSIWRGNGKIKNHFWGRTVSMSEYLNKYKAALGKGNSTKLGRFLPKATSWMLEGCTNRFAGGKLAVVMQAGIFADMLLNTFKAPKGEKGKTFAERFVNDFTYFLAMPFAVMGMHKVGGFKYAGLDEAGRQAYRTALEQFNNNVKNKAFGSKADYKAAKKALKDMLGTKNIKNPITKLLQKAGSLMNIGNERILSYRSSSSKNLNLLRKCANGNIMGVPLRLIIGMFVLPPIIAKAATKMVHAVVGRPTKSVLDEEEDEVSNEQELQQEQYTRLLEEAQKQAAFNQANGSTNLLNQYRTPQTQSAQVPFVSNNSPTNMLNMYKNGNPYQNKIPSVPSNEQTVTSKPQTETAAKDEPKQSDEPVRTYIPSPEPFVSANNVDISAVDKALKRADEVEKIAMETLSMRN